MLTFQTSIKTMNVLINTYKISDLVDAIQIGYRECLRDRGELPRCVTQSEAERIYGGALLKKWRTAGLIEPVKTGDSRNNMVLYDAQRLDILYSSTVFPNKKQIL
jgi:hypothetical protein